VGRCGVRAKYASHLHPSCGWVPGAPPGSWTFLSSLSEHGFFSILLGDRGPWTRCDSSRLARAQGPGPRAQNIAKLRQALAAQKAGDPTLVQLHRKDAGAFAAIEVPGTSQE
jgi:hypothetical protein